MLVNRQVGDELRCQMIGVITDETIIVFVISIERESNIRIISARKASKKERYLYGQETTDCIFKEFER